MRKLQKHKYTSVCHAGLLMWCPPKIYHQVLEMTEKCVQQSSFTGNRAALLSSFDISDPFLKGKDNEVSRFSTKEKGFYEISGS